MALSPATGLANYSAGISSSVLTVDSNSDRVGIGTTNPQDTLQVGTAITMGSGAVTATQGNFQNVNVTGTLTYEDVTSVDAVGIITAKSGITITGGGLSVVGDTDLVGNLTGVNATGISSIANVSGTTLNITGVSTLGNLLVGGGTTDLVVNGNARITGILTMGTSSITLDGTQNKIISGKYDFLGISTSHNDTAVDVFVYDTSKDSDDGEWRKKTSHTSWYNETLNTATRGSRKEFPAVAVIVAETSKVTIYDGDDPDLPMWMVFNRTAEWSFIAYANSNISSISASNGLLCVAAVTVSGGLNVINFIEDNFIRYQGNSEIRKSNLDISGRNTNQSNPSIISTSSIVNAFINDVAMTVLPNAPIDDTTGLPVSTIVIGTNSGLSVITDGGSIFDLNIASRPYSSVDFTSDNLIFAVENPSGVDYDLMRYFEIPSADRDNSNAPNTYGPSSFPALFPTNTKGNIFDSFAYGSPVGLSLIDHADGTAAATNGMIAYATTSYNTGWMQGDIKLATLSSNVGAAITFTNLSTNGDLADSSDLSSWTAYNATLSHQTDAMRVADNGDFSKAYQSFTTVSGRKYIASVNCKTLSGSDAVLGLRADNSGVNSWAPDANRSQDATTGTKHVVFTASGPTSYIELGSTGGGFAEYQDVRIDEVKVEDRSANDNPLEVYGTITKTAVATGADLVSYSGFSASNNLVQLYNSDLNFGTGDFSIIVWIKKETLTTNHFIFERSNGSNETNRFVYWISSSGQFGIYLDGSDSYGSTGQFVGSNNWRMVSVVRRGSQVYFGLDGLEIEGNNSFTSNITGAGTENLVIAQYGSGTPGNYNYGADYGLDQIANLRLSASAPSPEQIKKIYEDEKCLFHENAKATLYGSSDAVTALAYDEVTDQLHVGTSSGRSDFQGLRRINNTTTAVTTAISAHDLFIIEQ